MGQTGGNVFFSWQHQRLDLGGGQAQLIHDAWVPADGLMAGLGADFIFIFYVFRYLELTQCFHIVIPS